MMYLYDGNGFWNAKIKFDGMNYLLKNQKQTYDFFVEKTEYYVSHETLQN